MTKIYPNQYSGILESFRSGVPVKTLAEMYRVNKVTIYRILENKCGVVISEPYHSGRAGRDGMIIEDYLSGHTIKDIAYKFNLSIPSIYRIIRLYKKSCIRK